MLWLTWKNFKLFFSIVQKHDNSKLRIFTSKQYAMCHRKFRVLILGPKTIIQSSEFAQQAILSFPSCHYGPMLGFDCFDQWPEISSVVHALPLSHSHLVFFLLQHSYARILEPVFSICYCRDMNSRLSDGSTTTYLLG